MPPWRTTWILFLMLKIHLCWRRGTPGTHSCLASHEGNFKPPNVFHCFYRLILSNVFFGDPGIIQESKTWENRKHLNHKLTIWLIHLQVFVRLWFFKNLEWKTPSFLPTNQPFWLVSRSLQRFLGVFQKTTLEANCLKGDSPPCTLQAGAPFCTRPCMINATLNFGIVDASWPLNR